MRTDFKRIIPHLVHHGVEFILVGGVAAIAHGSARATYDVDVVYATCAGRRPASRSAGIITR